MKGRKGKSPGGGEWCKDKGPGGTALLEKVQVSLAIDKTPGEVGVGEQLAWWGRERTEI